MSERISNSEFLAVMQEAFSRGQELKFTPSGRSMLPMLDGVNDTVTFAPKPDRLKKYDVAFYRRPTTGQLVLHRVVGLDKNGYIFSGDGQFFYEKGITDEDVLALMVAFTHNGKDHTPKDLPYRFYIHRMMFKKRLRITAIRIYRRLFKK